MIGDIYTAFNKIKQTRVTLIEQSDGTLLMNDCKNCYYNMAGNPVEGGNDFFGPIEDVRFERRSRAG